MALLSLGIQLDALVRAAQGHMGAILTGAEDQRRAAAVRSSVYAPNENNMVTTHHGIFRGALKRSQAIG